MLTKTKTLSALAVMILSTSSLSHAVLAQAGGAGAAAGAAGAGNAGTAGAANAGTAGNTGTAGQAATGNAGAVGPTAAGNAGAATNAGTPGNTANGQNGVGDNNATTGTSTNNSTTGTGATNGQGTNGQGTNGNNATGGQNAAPPSAGNSHPIGNGGTGPYDLSATVNAAIASSTDLANAGRLVDIDSKKIDQARSAGRPMVGALASATRFDQATKVSIAGSAPLTVLYDNTETLQAQITDRLDLTGQIAAAADQAKLQQLQDKFSYTAILNGRILQAQTIYFSVLRAEHQVAVAQAAKATAQVQLDIATKTYEAGTGQKVDQLRASTQVAQADQDLLSAQNSLDVAKANFNDLVGQPLTAPVSLVDTNEATTGVTFSNDDVTAPPTFKEISTVDVDQINLDADIKTADENRPELLTDRVVIRSAQTGIKLAHAGLEPTLDLEAVGDYYPTTSFETPRQRTAAITATLTIPIYDGGATHDKVDEAKIQRTSAEASLASDTTTIELYVRQAYFNLLTAAHQLTSANTALSDAITARQLAQVRYDNQVSLYLEVTDAQSALVQAENSQLNAVYDYYIAKAQYANALGTPNYGK